VYNEQLSVWRSSRMKTSDVSTQLFSTASWKSVPVALQTRLGEHYIE
jgi:hypothetical protein